MIGKWIKKTTLIYFLISCSVFKLFAQDLPIHAGPYLPTASSLKQYHYPDWFRDAKFGIWAHWGPQAVPRHGDWYARELYHEGGDDYKDHLARYGHPSHKGYKDIIPLWKAERWDPEKLMALYKKTGARYFVSMGSHHDNFFLWNSTIHRWNAVNMGPHKDVVGIWQKAAKNEGFYFGVSEHLAASYTWFQKAHLADTVGQFKGIPYDGNDPQYADLYHTRAEPGDNGWLTTNPEWMKEWFNDIKELVDSYHPDLLYSDSKLPFEQYGRNMLANFYNGNLFNTTMGNQLLFIPARKLPTEHGCRTWNVVSRTASVSIHGKPILLLATGFIELVKNISHPQTFFKCWWIS